ncbi:MAG: VWA domain-containing protein [Labilithrix sp.]|nr:VWA domain-containing protein [Labilithrix sp.]MCW5815955.1 VWA domain-containing protein [Labilithrix sp.]
MSDVISQLDLVFCVDLTSSMTPFIEAARAQMVRILDALRATEGVDVRVAVVGYRDHGTVVKLVEVHPFAANSAKTKAVLDKLKVQSPPENTDAAEAVFSGLAAVVDLAWRAGAYRVCVLVGDAPPHACSEERGPHPDRFAIDPTGMSLDDVANTLEENGIFLHALGMIPSVTPFYDKVLERAFTRLGVGSGGAYYAARTGDAAMAVVETVSKRCLADLDFDRRLFSATKRELDLAELVRALDASEDAVNAGLMRLRQRGLLASAR